MQRGKAILGVAALALMVGCTGAREQVSGPADVEDRPIPGAEPADGAGKSEAGEMGTTGTLADAGGVEGSPLAGVEGSEMTLVIYFDFDSSEVHPDDRVVVEAHAQHLAGDANMEVVLEGHADERGSREYNIALGERRADAVRQLMTLLGATNPQIRIISYGEERPAAVGHDESAWRLNRRVEIIYRVRE